MKSIKLMFIYGLQGSKSISRLICFTARYHGVDVVISLGDIVSPSIIHWLNTECGIRILGVLGRYDNASVVWALKRVNGLAECRFIDIDGVKIYGFGLSGCLPRRQSNLVDVLVSSIPGVMYTCCRKYSDIVDSIIETMKPRLIALGGCSDPCQFNNVISPGDVRRGYVCLVELNRLRYDVVFQNIYTYIL